MKRALRGLLVAVAGMLFALPALAYELPKPQLIAVYFTADWCPNCKVLTPILGEARIQGKLDDQPILFVAMNLTDKTTIHQSVMLAQALGIAPFVQQQGSGTGYVAVLDARTKAELQRFDRTSTRQQIIDGVTKQLALTGKTD